MDLYLNALKQQQLTDMGRLSLEYKKDSVYNDLKIYQTKLNFEEQFSKIISKQDELEAQIKDLKNRIPK